MKRAIILVAILVSCFVRCTCDPDILDNERSVFTGTVLDQNDDPLPNIDVSVMVADLTIGNATTSQSGRFELISLTSSYPDHSVLFEPVAIDSEFSDFKLNYKNKTINQVNAIGSVSLPKKTFVEVQFRNESGGNPTISVSAEFKIAECIIDNDDTVEVDFSNCFITDRYSNQFTPSTALSSIEFVAVKGTLAELTYRIDDNDPITEVIPLNQNQIVYEVVF